MPTSDSSTVVENADGSSTTTWSDGTSATTWPNGTSQTTFPDGSTVTTWSDGRTLTAYPDGTQTLTDANGTQFDPGSGQPLSNQGDSSTPTPQASPADTAKEIVEGLHTIADLTEAAGYLGGDAAEGLLAAVEPVSAVLTVVVMLWNVIQAVQAEEHGCAARGWCYSVMYGALDRGTPPTPTFHGSLGGPDQDALDQQAWESGVADGVNELANGAHGISLRNRILLRVAHDGDPSATLTALWQAVCAEGGDTLAHQADAYPSLSLDSPVGA